MKPKQWVLIAIVAILVIGAVKVYAGNLQLTTYYPAPTGYYDSMTVRRGLAVPCYTPGNGPNPAPNTLPQNSVWIENPNCV